MARYTVSEVAAMAHVSVRTLHHYHDIGLLHPAYVGENGYRYYEREELLRLQQILLHREFGIPLADIAAILDAPGFDRLEALRQQRNRVAQNVARSAEMLRTIDRTIAELEGERTMKDADLYSGIVDPQKQAEYEAWLVEKYGPAMIDRIDASRAAMADLSQQDVQARMAELQDVEQQLAQAMRDGVEPGSPALDPLIDRHRTWVGAAWGSPCPPAAYAGLAEVYEHPDFEARYEQIGSGFGEYLRTAMRRWAGRQA